MHQKLMRHLKNNYGMIQNNKDDILGRVLLHLVNKGETYKYYYTLQQIFMRLNVAQDLRSLMNSLENSGYIVQSLNSKGTAEYSLSQEGRKYLISSEITTDEYKSLESFDVKNLAFVKKLIGP